MNAETMATITKSVVMIPISPRIPAHAAAGGAALDLLQS
jgi:hypothetical protein